MSRINASAVCLLVVLLVNPTFAQTATIVIGESAEAGQTPEPGQLKSPFGVDFDAQGNMFIVELEGGRVHKLDRAGNFSTIAGNGTKGYAGDGGPAKDAVFNGMHNIAVTPEGDIYISDSWNHCIRKIDGESGIITTFAGTGTAGFSGDGGQASKATFDFLMCISLNPSNNKIHLADLKNRRIRAIDLKTNVVTTVAGNGEKGVPVDGALATESPLVDPRAVAADSQGNVYILERGGHALRVVDQQGRIRTVAGTGKGGAAVGPALSAQLNSPKHLAVDGDDNVIIADDQNKRICLYDPQSRQLTSILGSGAENPQRRLFHPHGVCVHESGALLVVDTGHHRILKLQR